MVDYAALANGLKNYMEGTKMKFGFEKVSFEQFKKDYNKCFAALLGDSNDETIREIYDDIKLPTRKTQYAAGYDIKSTVGIILSAYNTMGNKSNPIHEITIPTGLRVKLPTNTFLAIVPRSGSGFKTGAHLANTMGVIDADYYNADNEGHIMIKLVGGFKDLEINRSDGIAQAIVIPYATFGDEVNTERIGGFGSTGK